MRISRLSKGGIQGAKQNKEEKVDKDLVVFLMMQLFSKIPVFNIIFHILQSSNSK